MAIQHLANKTVMWRPFSAYKSVGALVKYSKSSFGLQTLSKWIIQVVFYYIAGQHETRTNKTWEVNVEMAFQSRAGF